MKRRLIAKWRFKLIFWLWPRRKGSACFCANRSRWTYHAPNADISLEVRDRTKPDGYAREELYSMLKLIREEEKRQGWTVPEPEVRS